MKYLTPRQLHISEATHAALRDLASRFSTGKIRYEKQRTQRRESSANQLCWPPKPITFNMLHIRGSSACIKGWLEDDYGVKTYAGSPALSRLFYPDAKGAFAARPSWAARTIRRYLRTGAADWAAERKGTSVE